MKNPVNEKQLNIEFYYGYMNIHLERLQYGINAKNDVEIAFQKQQLQKTRNALLKLGYFERGSKNE